jgi:hypothetical protein
LNAKRSFPAKIFLKKLIQAAPDQVAAAIRELHLPPNAVSPLLPSIILVYHRHRFLSLQHFLATFSTRTIVEQLRLFVSSVGDANFRELLLSLSASSDFASSISEEVAISLDNEDGRFVAMILVFLEW